MSEKRYQIFLSSTFSDLEDERQKVMQSLLEMNCIPSGMEFFPASDEATFEFIKGVIQQSDYYILIVSGRYGSIASDGISYTEKEYDYALSIGKPTLCFVRRNIETLPAKKIENTDAKKDKLNRFRDKVQNSGRLVKLWENGDELAGKVATTLMSAFTRYPAVGWVRGDQISPQETLNQLVSARTEIEKLKSQIGSQQSLPRIENLAELDDVIEIQYQYRNIRHSQLLDGSIKMTLGEILTVVGHNYRTPSNTSGMASLDIYLRRKKGYSSLEITNDIDKKILTQFEILGVMQGKQYSLQNGGHGLFFTLTNTGLSKYLSRAAIVKENTSND